MAATPLISPQLPLPQNLRSRVSNRSRNSLVHLKSASATTQFQPRRRKGRSTISASSSCCCLLPATITTRVSEALLYALRYDSNPGVRLKAIEGLGSYVKNDVRVRDAVLEALVNDSNPGLRTQALHLLEPVRADSSVRVVLQKLAENDQNLYIRSQARNVLSQMSEID